MCLAADVPLVESGTAGYLGQATVIKKVYRYLLPVAKAVSFLLLLLLLLFIFQYFKLAVAFSRGHLYSCIS